MSASSSSGGGGACGACKFLRRKCAPGCIFAPYFDSEQGSGHFAVVHKVFGSSNVSKLLQRVPINKRLDAVVTMCYEAQARLRDPVHGCVSNILAHQQLVMNLQAEVSYLQAHLAALGLPISPPPPPMPHAPRPLTMAGLPPPAADPPISFDLETLFDPLVQPAWALPQIQLDFRQYGGNRDNVDLQALASGLLQRQGTTPPATSALPPPRSGCD